jgi:O-antigen ligase
VTASAGLDPAARRDRLGAWCGWVLVGAAVLTPLVGWLGPLAFAPLVSLVGLLGLPAIRITDKDRPVAALLFAALIWAAVSTIWSPHVPKDAGSGTALKLALQLPLYWSAVCVARRADPRVARLALRILAWGMAALGLILLVDAFTAGAIYQRLHLFYDGPIRPDLAGRNLGRATFVLALLWPLAAIGGLRAGAPAWLAAPMVLGTLAAAVAFGSDAPAISVGLAGGLALAAWRWPTAAPRALAAVAVAFCLATPALIWLARQSGVYEPLQQAVPLSWSMRMGYWSHAVDWIGDHPFRGWGLDASRMFAPGIQLHPHNADLQIWLELGALGAVATAAFWWLAVRGLARRTPDLAVCAVVASTGVYLLFGGLNFGVWQEWWLALGALVAVFGAMAMRQPTLRPST